MSELQFEGQREGEQLKLVFRRHILTARRGVFWLISCIAIGIIPMILWKGIPATLWIFLGAVLVGLIGLFYTYLLWYFSVYIVTNERIRQVLQKGLFKKTVVDLSFNKIEEISFHTGVMGGIFGYGTIIIQTGAGDVTISTVPDAEKVYNKLQNLFGKVK